MSTANPATTNTDQVRQTDRSAAGKQPDNTPATGQGPAGGGGGGATGPAGGDLTGTYPNPALAAIGGGAIGPIGDGTHVAVVTRDAKGRVTALTSTAITFPTGRGFFYPEDYGAGGGGGTNDSAALAACDAAALAAGGLSFLTGTYALGSQVSLSGDVWQTSYSEITSFGGNANGLILTGNSNHQRVILGSVVGFTGVAISMEGPAIVLRVHLMSNNGVHVDWPGGTPAIDCDVFLNLVGNGTTVFRVAGGFGQGSKMYCVFSTANTYGLLFDGSAGVQDSNECTFNSFDAQGAAGTPIVFYNSNSSAGGQPLINWTLKVENWVGGGTLSKFASGAFQVCRFFHCNLGGNTGFAWDFYTVTNTNSANVYESGQQTIASIFPQGIWQTVANNRSSFWPYIAPNNPPYYNSVYCTGTTGVNIASGAIFTTYVYSTLTDGSNANNWRALPQTPIGLICVGIADNTATHANEIIVTWVNATNATIGSGTAFVFNLITGLP